MSDDANLVSESIEEMLVALASGAREAQEALSEIAPLDPYGRPLPTYHFPYLDFEIAVEVETVRKSGARPFLRLVSRAGTPSSEDQTSQTRSTISGRLIAVPPGEGLPVPVISLSAELQGGQYQIEIDLSNSAGEQLSGVRVELNIDTAASTKLSAANGAEIDALRAGTRLSEAVLVTGEDGRAQGWLSVDEDEPEKAIIVVTAQAGPRSASLSILAGGAE